MEEPASRAPVAAASPRPAVWNVELARAAEARVCYYMSIGSSKEFMWRKAHSAILAVEKDIRRRGPSGLIVNMPRMREVTVQQELEAIVRGERPVVPAEMVAGLPQPPASPGAPGAPLCISLSELELARDYARHPYMRRMEYRGGGYAILMALHRRRLRPGQRQFMYKAELVREAQPYCDISMVSQDRWAGSGASGWASHQSLLAHRLVVAGQQPAAGRRAAAEFRLTDDGHRFLDAMLRKWPFASAGAGSTTTVDGADCGRSRSPYGRNGAQPGAPDAGADTAAADAHIAASPTLQGRRRWGRLFLAPEGAPQENVVAPVELTPPKVLPASGRRPAVADQADVIEIMSDDEPSCSEGHALVEASTVLGPRGPAGSSLRLLVDDRERLQDADPRGVFERLTTSGTEFGFKVTRRRLLLGDFAWVEGGAGSSDDDCQMVDCIVERKRISDLVGRSALGAHVKQLQRLESCGLRHAFLLLEGGLQSASSCPVFDEQECEAVGSTTDVLRCAEDIDDMCARLLVRGSKVGVLLTKDFEGTCRTLSLMSSWFRWQSPQPPCVRPGAVAATHVETLRTFERASAERAVARDRFQEVLLHFGVPTAVAELLRRRFTSAEEARAALLACENREHRRRYFDFLPLAGLRADTVERIHAALGFFDVAEATAAGGRSPGQGSGLPDCASATGRLVQVAASPLLFRRLGAPPSGEVQSGSVSVQRDATLWTDPEGISCCTIRACQRILSTEDSAVPRRCSASVLLAVVPGTLLLETVRDAARQLEGAPEDAVGGGAAAARVSPQVPAPAIADVAALALSARLPQPPAAGQACGPCRPHRMVVIEGLRAAVLARARAAPAAPARAMSGLAQEIAENALLPRLLLLAELTALALEFSAGWRVRVHENRASSATVSFIRAVARAALEDAPLPFSR